MSKEVMTVFSDDEKLMLLKELCMANGVSGYENAVADLIISKIKDSCDCVMKDSLGNVLAYKKGKISGEKRVMLCAHMDEVGFAVKNINDDGTIDFCEVGMVSTVLPSKRVVVGDNAVEGVISARPVHLIGDRKKACKESDLVIDIGAESKEDAEKYVKVGDFAAFKSEFMFLGDDFIKAKALDDRIGCTAMCLVCQSELPCDMYFAFTVGEELGGVGAAAATNRIKPDVCIVLEGTTASDIQGVDGADRVCVLGDGPVCPHMDGGTKYNYDIYNSIVDFARVNNVKIQTKTKIAGGTDASKIQRCLSGVTVAAVSLPCRYIHTSSSVASKSDVLSYFELVTKLTQGTVA